MAEIPEGSSLDHAGVDRRTYEPQNCGDSRPHGQHFHTWHGLKNYKLNCPGVLGPREPLEIRRSPYGWTLYGEDSKIVASANDLGGLVNYAVSDLDADVLVRGRREDA